MIPVGISGIAGRMGQTILALLYEAPYKDLLQLAGALEHPTSPHIGKDARSISGGDRCGVPVSHDMKSLEKCKVVIDFSSPDNTMRLASFCADHGIALVVGTTGLSVMESSDLTKLGDRIALLHSPNMSVGVNLLFQLVYQSAKALGDSFDVEIVEAHHHFKKDAPSGTAQRLKEMVLKALSRGEENVVYGRSGIVGQRPPGEIGVHAIRGGDVVGDHTVYFFADGERVELTHRASSRQTFASGSLRAAHFIASKPPGVYTMAHVLNMQGE